MVRKADPNNRSRVLHAACEIFNEKPFNSARMSAIAQRAGLAVGTVYLYFPSKEALVHGIVDDFIERMTIHIAPYFADENFEQMIAAVIHQALVFAQLEQEVVRLVDMRNGLGYSAERSASEQQQLDTIIHILHQQMEAGVVYPCDAEVLAEMLRGLIEWVYKTALLWKHRDMAVYEEAVVRFIQRALIIQPSFDAQYSISFSKEVV